MANDWLRIHAQCAPFLYPNPFLLFGVLLFVFLLALPFFLVNEVNNERLPLDERNTLSISRLLQTSIGRLCAIVVFINVLVWYVVICIYDDRLRAFFITADTLLFIITVCNPSRSFAENSRLGHVLQVVHNTMAFILFIIVLACSCLLAAFSESYQGVLWAMIAIMACAFIGMIAGWRYENDYFAHSERVFLIVFAIFSMSIDGAVLV